MALKRDRADFVEQSLNHSYYAGSIPPENSDTYKWRGDLGLLDRLAYGDSKQIPRNWSMTSLDAVRIAQNQPPAIEPPTGAIELLADRPYLTIDDKSIFHTSDNALSKKRPSPSTEVNGNLGEVPKKKR